MELELNGEYLVDSIRTSYTATRLTIQNVKVIRETGEAFLIELQDRERIWFLKKWKDSISIIEKI